MLQSVIPGRPWGSILGLALMAATAFGCASARPAPRAVPREATEAERAQVARSVVPLLIVAGVWRGPQDGCAALLGVLPVDQINLGVGSSTSCKFALLVTEGALRTLPPDQFQAAMAHELGHVQLGHLQARVKRRQDEAERKKQIESTGTTAGAIATAIPGIGPLAAMVVAGIQTGAENASASTFRAYDRGEEEAADRFAADLLRRLPGGEQRCLALVDLFERLEHEHERDGRSRWSDWRSTHPAPAHRAEAVRAECSAGGGT